MACDCIAAMNAELERLDANTKIVPTLCLPKGGGQAWLTVTVGVEKVDRKRRVGPGRAVPTFCPFCAAPYTAEPASTEGGAP